MYSEHKELWGLLKKKVDFETFKKEYFGIDANEVGDSIAWEFYEDFIMSKGSLEDYKMATIEVAE